ncbi:LbtU family siderophore porin [Thiorhodovibrio frisius]|uniref:LbtU family siderophore porin n=1 Tax=Thiorhodovibrio frisius TaxID=631362 RepID=H8Z8F7_9GAMM|nr:LbtU family siderophore porin [Thiorhodovibrio frisius]EIC19362.1 hypothetical protein Thi970DRAFT_04879 [Thiorhodovibrio frisius]WPL22339.1 hypothetical protein Thiofri_02499 [Thiorhodovibrio frisius]
MTNRQLSGAITIAIASITAQPVLAQQVLEQGVEQLEQENARQAAPQTSLIAQQNQQNQKIQGGTPGRVGKLNDALESSEGGWFQGIEIGGLIELEASYISPYEGDSKSDVVLATVELGIASQINDWVDIEASLLYEQDATDLEVDLAVVTIHHPDVSPLFLTAGQFYLPFGVYETNLISEPLTLDIGEARETAAQLGFLYQGFSGSLYAFNGDHQIDGKNQINSWGANLAWAVDTDSYSLTAGAGYINDLGDSNSLQDAVSDNRQAIYDQLVEGEDPSAGQFRTDPTERTGGWTANLGIIIGDFNLIAEYLTASERFDPSSLAYRNKGAQPSAWNLEVGYSFPVFGRDSIAAIAYQGTEQAVTLELPETSWLLGWSVEIFERTALAFEYRHDSDYSVRNGGTGKDASAVVAQLAVEF